MMSSIWIQLVPASYLYNDSDQAGELRTRKATLGGAIMHGLHTIRIWSKNAVTVALPSAEMEVCSEAVGSVQGLGMKSLQKEIVLDDVKMLLHCDASAALKVVGRMRHISANVL